MDKDMQKCMRCHGRKEIYKVGGAYSFLDTGGVKVKCPMCNGEGTIKTLEAATKAAVKKNLSTDKKSSTVQKGKDKKDG